MVYRLSILIIYFVNMISCQVYNSSSNDSIQYMSDGTPFGDAKVIFAIKCTPCHNYYTRTQQDLIDSGLVVAGDRFSSLIFSRLKGSNVGGVENMPNDGQLSDDELEKIKIWIESI